MSKIIKGLILVICLVTLLSLVSCTYTNERIIPQIKAGENETIVVNSVPVAEVELDGLYLGRTPAVIKLMDDNPHNLKLTAKGYPALQYTLRKKNK